MTEGIRITIGGSVNLQPRYFWNDSPVNDHADASAADCATEVRKYIESHGLTNFLADWELETDVTVHVGGEQAWP